VSHASSVNYVDQDSLASPSGVIRVFVAESSRMASELVEATLSRNRPRFEVHAFGIRSPDIHRELEKCKPDVALLSSNLQDGPLAGFKVLFQLRQARTKTSIVMMLDSDEPELVIDSFRGGAKGVYSRQTPSNYLPKCICAVHSGQFWINNGQLQFLLELVSRLSPVQTLKPGGMERLTKREWGVTKLVAEGLHNEEIALKLGISEHTVRNYLCHIFDKLGLSSRVELVLCALSQVQALPPIPEGGYRRISVQHR
jgi:two-component system nitrate/nitrite response regulator NarL